jgi:hypothetical protein
MIGSSAVRRSDESLWAVTSYFNPMKYQRRRANYRLFRERLGVPLLTVELAYGPDFELTRNDADILVQLRGVDILWQKERLLNVGMQHLPDACRKLALVDCDLIFELDDFGERLSGLLDRFMLVQMFSRVHHMPRNWVPDELETTKAEFTRLAVAFRISSGVPPAILLNGAGGHADASVAGKNSAAPGFAWAARRELFERHRVYDGCIVGGAVSALAAAAYGCFDHAAELHRMNDRQKAHFMAWARPFHEMVGAQPAFLDCNLFHLWHGDFGHRRYAERHQGLERFHFDPADDIAIDASGCWRWSTDKPDLHEYVRNYLTSRREDG